MLHPPSKRTICLLAIYYLYIPFAIFLCSWVKLWIGMPLALLLGIAPIFLSKSISGDTVTGSRYQEAVIFLTLLIWVILSGIGGYVWQNRWDHFFRNALFMDLVNRPWPVHDGVNILTYYLGYWLPPALIAKLTGSAAPGWFASFLFGLIGILIAFRLTLQSIGCVKLRFLLPFILFSGVDIVYYIFFDHTFRHDLHIELWSDIACWESNTTLLYWVYNQAIPSWVATMLILNFGRVRGLAPITLSFLLISSSFSVIGLFPLALYYLLDDARHSKSFLQSLKTILNPYNILAILGAIPIGLFLLMNRNIGLSFGIGGMPFTVWLSQVVLLFSIEILVFLPFIYRQIKKSPEFYVLIASNILLLFVQQESKYGDFNCRVELPLNYFLTVQIAIFLGRWEAMSRRCRTAFLTISLFAIVTPATEIGRILIQTVRKPAAEYRSILYPTVFELDVLRNNFVADSVLCPGCRPPGMSLFRYPDSPPSPRD
ncbi:MAG: hypothetical protein J1E29_00825 [Duncaniella sp.]|nr:hypothetical protein [Duncaniella sp.]